ncbi:ABC transporter substrate-binding protein [Paenibacillus lutimineralis]|uniref:Helix-turn-helix domain-containing protein n=1 Tax=Paenibacillus lutimineralis TaxID=2707005 RepID=A0A3Q9IC98_9BACL|nr:ABC transporter substrate-binding protein [Paenibacillus lutimineralis]AZS17570.1 helix-turn-helix domain-containing protein [Paenibacillus lutimineralis]
MNNQKNEAAPLHNLLFHLSDIAVIDQPVGWESELCVSDGHTFIVILKGQGSIDVEEHEFLFAAAKCYFLSPGQHYQLKNGYDSGMSLYRMTFSVIEVGKNLHRTYIKNFISGRVELTVFPSVRLIQMAHELYAGNDATGDLEVSKQQLRFHEFIHVLIEHNLHAGQSSHSKQAVEGTIRYMESRYMDQMTVKELAESAHVPHWRYSSIFQELTGKRPLEYLNDLRINRSKHLLVHTNEPLREVARQVGFLDEYYFNRRFRQSTGIAPKQFARYMRKYKKVKDWTGHVVDIPVKPERIVYYGETLGDLLVLGIEPIGGIFPLHVAASRNLQQSMQDVGHPINPDILAKLRPDLIILANADERQYNLISGIAPTVTFNSFAPLTVRLHVLGEMLDHRLQAEKWLNRYHAKAETVWKQLSSLVDPGETASVLQYDHGRRLYVMGSAGLTPGLYHPHGFRPVSRVQKLLNNGQGFAEISEEDLSAFAGDRLFIMQSKHPESRAAMEELMSSRSWLTLPVVQRGHVYELEASEWNYGDAITQELLLELLPRLLQHTLYPEGWRAEQASDD